MPRVIDLPHLRNRRRVFRSRYHAGQVLAEMVTMEADRWPRPLLLAVPAGGIPVAVALQERLGWPADLLVIGKVYHQDKAEWSYAAVAWDGTIYLNEALVEHLGLTPEEVEADLHRFQEQAKTWAQRLRGHAASPNLQGHSVFLVDDGLNTGATMRVAARLVRRLGAARVAVAVPTAHKEALWRLAAEVDTVYCPNIHEDTPYTVDDAYEARPPLDDDAVQTWLRRLHLLRQDAASGE